MKGDDVARDLFELKGVEVKKDDKRHEISR